MPAKEVIAGISVSDNLASLAVLEHRESTIELLFLDEQMRTDSSDFWYVNLLDRFAEHSRAKISQVAIALDSAELTIIQCPLDVSLNQSERNEHVNWELSQYINDYHPREYINDVHILETRSQEGIQQVLVVAVQRNIIFGLQDTLNNRGMALGIVDVNHFAVNSTLLHTHSEIEKGICASIGLSQSRIDASILRHGHMVAYRYSLPKTQEDSVSFMKTILDRQPLSGIYVYGVHLTKDQEKLVKSLAQYPVVVLNPFRRTLISLNFPNFTRYAANVHRFAAAVGIALRKA